MNAGCQKKTNFVYRIFLILVIVITSFCSFAQNKEIATIILIRHAEKNINQGDDPSLSTAGKIRANKLATLFPNAMPSEMYATPYKRTVETLEPWEIAKGLIIKKYDASKLPDLAEQLKEKKGKTIVVSGHSNTTPALVNLLINEDKYKQLPDEEYNKIFVITITKGKAKAKVIEY